MYLAESGGNEGEGPLYLTPVVYRPGNDICVCVPHTSNEYVGRIYVFNVRVTGFFIKHIILHIACINWYV